MRQGGYGRSARGWKKLLAALAWPAVASCVKRHLEPGVTPGLDELANAGCDCGSKTDTAPALKQLASLRKVFASASATPPAGIAKGQSGARRYGCR